MPYIKKPCLLCLSWKVTGTYCARFAGFLPSHSFKASTVLSLPRESLKWEWPTPPVYKLRLLWTPLRPCRLTAHGLLIGAAHTLPADPRGNQEIAPARWLHQCCHGYQHVDPSGTEGSHPTRERPWPIRIPSIWFRSHRPVTALVSSTSSQWEGWLQAEWNGRCKQSE